MTAQNQKEVILPTPAPEETPISYAARLSEWYCARASFDHRKKHGIFFTPESVALYMGNLCRNGTGHFVRVADPAAGTGILGVAVCTSLAYSTSPPRHIELVCYETDTTLIEPLDRALRYLRRWLSHRRVEFRYRLINEDFVLANASLLDRDLLGGDAPRFDAVICNPPYFKIAKSDLRAAACPAVVHGQPNIYGLFMAAGSALLREGGRFVFITPRSYAAGPYFRKLREYFFASIRPTDLHVFESRTDAFENVLQEAAIIAGTRTGGWRRNARALRVRISSSSGSNDINKASVRTLPIGDVLSDGTEGSVLSFPISRLQDRVAAVVNSWSGSLHKYGWEVSTGRVVAFRAKPYLQDRPSHLSAPLLWLQNVQRMKISWPLITKKPQHFARSKESEKLLLPRANYVLMRRFSAKEEKQRITAAPFLATDLEKDNVALENHLNYIYKCGGTLREDEAYGLAALLNSELINSYFRISNGNTQVNAADLRSLKLPALSAIRRIGRRVRENVEQLETIVTQESGYRA